MMNRCSMCGHELPELTVMIAIGQTGNEKPIIQRSCDMVKGTSYEHGIVLAKYFYDIMAGGQLGSFLEELKRLYNG